MCVRVSSSIFLYCVCVFAWIVWCKALLAVAFCTTSWGGGHCWQPAAVGTAGGTSAARLLWQETAGLAPFAHYVVAACSSSRFAALAAQNPGLGWFCYARAVLASGGGERGRRCRKPLTQWQQPHVPARPYACSHAASTHGCLALAGEWTHSQCACQSTCTGGGILLAHAPIWPFLVVLHI